MNREILFRGKRVDNGEWVEGNYIFQFDHTKMEACGFITKQEQDFDKPNFTPVEIDIKTLGQFTGLTDKNGKKIFEGDIVKRELAYIKINASVSWNEKYLQYELNCVSGRHKGNYWWLSSDSQDYELLGNCFDNPETFEGV